MPNDPILDAFDLLAQRETNAPVVVSHASVATRGEVDALSRRLAATLERSGVPRGAYVLLACANGTGFLAALLGARRAGFVPVLADWSSPEAERTRIEETLGIALQLTCDEPFPDGAATIRLRHTGIAPAAPPDGAGYVKLTSGSSGLPSGVAVAAEALAADDDHLAAMLSLVPSDRFVATIPWSHSYGLSSLVLPALRRGCVLAMAEDMSPWAPIEAAREHRATRFPTVPAYLQSLASLAAPPTWPETLRTVISAGAPLNAETAARFLDTFGRHVHVFYGASESGGIAYDREGGAAMRGTVGTPIDGVSVELNEDGAVDVRSAAVGLCHVPDVNDRLSGGVFRSADLAAWTQNGELALRGRADALINVGGKKVQPGEIETVLRAMPGVREAFVVGVPAPGDERTIVRAFVACDTASLSYTDVSAWCRERLAGHKVPRSIVRLETLPRTGRGKIDRAALASWKPDDGS